MGKIAIWVQLVLLRCFNQTKDYAATLSSIGCIGKEEVLPCYYKRLHGTFRSVVAGLQFAILKVVVKVFLLVQQISHICSFESLLVFSLFAC